MRVWKAGRFYTSSGFHTLDGHIRNIDRVHVISRALAGKEVRGLARCAPRGLPSNAEHAAMEAQPL